MTETCRHGRSDTINGGLKRCLDCKSIYGHDGKWRHYRGPVTEPKSTDKDTP